MNSEIKICQNCKQQFTIEPEDFQFYEKIQVPAPTFCPWCRLIRQTTWRNERSLYRRRCALTGKDIITIFNPDTPVVVYDRDAWWSDAWDPLEFGGDYDFSKTFFSQFQDIFKVVPLPALFNSFCVNSPYSNHVAYLKNCYLVFASWKCEDTAYATQISECKNCFDLTTVTHCELGYDLLRGIKLYNVIFSDNCENCTDSAFLYDCKGCSNCFGCVSLRNKSYYFFNQPLAKEEYKKRIKEFDIGSYKKLEEMWKKIEEMKLKTIHRFATFSNVKNSTGDFLSEADNCKHCFGLRKEVKDCKYCVNGGYGMYEIYDNYGAGGNCELSYECIDAGLNSSRFLFGVVLYECHHVQYSYNCHNCHNVFGCIGLRNKEYCILNKQYTKEEYEELVPKIIQHMNETPYIDKLGRIYKYGEFFPSELSPFAYNETIAQEYSPLTKEETEKQGYSWKDPDVRDYKITLKADDLPDHIKDVDDSVLNEIIGCAHQGECREQCTTAFRIIREEFDFYKRANLPLPRLCPNCRHYARLKRQNLIKLWNRKCQCFGLTSENNIYKNTVTHFHGSDKCSNSFETSYAPERKEIVYCEACYNAEVV